METARFLRCVILLSGLALFCAPTHARAQHDPTFDTFTAGMLTFRAQACLELPVIQSNITSPVTFINNPSAVNDRKHFVKVSGPSNEGNINVNYFLLVENLQYVGNDLEQIGGVSANNVLIGLDGTGVWYERSIITATLGMPTGQHVALATSSITFRPTPTTAVTTDGHDYFVLP